MWRRHPRAAIAIGLLLLVALVIAGIATVLARDPTWWRDAALPGADAARRGEAVERGLSRAIYEPRQPGESWTIELQEADANAWLAERFPRWVENRQMAWPEGWSSPRVRFLAGSIIIGAEARGIVVGVEAHPQVDAAGQLRLPSPALRIGSAPALDPVSGRLIGGLQEALNEAESALIRIGAERGPDASWTIPADFSLDDGRVLRIALFQVLPGRLRIALSAVPPATD